MDATRNSQKYISNRRFLMNPKSVDILYHVTIRIMNLNGNHVMNINKIHLPDYEIDIKSVRIGICFLFFKTPSL